MNSIKEKAGVLVFSWGDLKRIRKLQTSDGHYIWQPKLCQSDIESTVMGIPYRVEREAYERYGEPGA